MGEDASATIGFYLITATFLLLGAVVPGSGLQLQVPAAGKITKTVTRPLNLLSQVIRA